MKKILILTTVLLAMAMFSYTQSITVTRPSSGEEVVKGHSYTIRWTKEGRMAENVKIRLFNVAGTERVLEIKNMTENSGHYECPANLFNSVIAGNYRIRVKTIDNEVFDDGDVFSLVDQGSEPGTEPQHGNKSIRILTPNGGRSLAQGSTIRILWKPKNLTNNVVISLLKNDRVFGTIVSGLAPGRISYDWRIGATELKTALPDTGFKIRIDERGGSGIFDVSDRSFAIEAPRNIDLSCYIGVARVSRALKAVRIVVNVKCRNFPGSLTNVPVKISLIRKSDGTVCHMITKRIPEITYKGSSYEYFVSQRLHFGDCWDAYSSGGEFEIKAVVDPEDNFRDRSRLNNTARKTIKKD